jgi:hypothetical protein
MASIDSDVAAVMALEQPVRELLEAIKAAEPAIERLSEAEYPGAGMVSGQVVFGALDPSTEGGLVQVLKALAALRVAGGNPAAYDYEFYVRQLGCTVEEVIADGHIRPEQGPALRQYAATVAR